MIQIWYFWYDSKGVLSIKYKKIKIKRNNVEKGYEPLYNKFSKFNINDIY